jgi:hypothetical protein
MKFHWDEVGGRNSARKPRHREHGENPEDTERSSPTFLLTIVVVTSIVGT